MELKKNKKSSTLTLSEVCDAYAAGDLHQALLEAQELKQAIIINGKAVTRLDTQCAQLLVAAQHDWEKAKCDYTIKDPSETMIQALNQIGLEALVGVSDVSAES